MSTDFFKSTFSGGEKTCVEVAHRGDSVLIRDSKYTGPATEQPIVSLSPAHWPTMLELTLSGKSGQVDTVTVTVHPAGGATIADQSAALIYDADEWDAFRKGVADGQFHRHI
ncbi:DUF397 domain-containing protein [Nocardia terpenica]|uniref:DUF397 domain-containing protein n=1 Tax=Nocardia terpenica TaxID=455432 RepID=UPI00031B75E2|nr:DUF397 domain-containing protein [Nocardia terpenica]NQE88685.1 DUF397 domain-containing protein [Nocardia terpenica]